MTIKQQNFGSFENQKISLYTLENSQGMQVRLMNFGATITQITIPNSKGQPVSIACGFDNFEDYFSEKYRANAPYFGCTVGRYCSQIKDAKFEIDGREYKLAKNCGENNLHGGTIGFDKKIWEAEPIRTENAVVFRLWSKDMEKGFPGNVEAQVKVTLTENNEIVLNYEAIADKKTPLSMTNHSYWNLSGFNTDIQDNLVKINTNKLMETDQTGAATGVVNVEGTINDLRSARTIKEVQSELGDGFEHFYIFDTDTKQLKAIAEIEDKESGRKLEVLSTEPCMLFYTAKYMADELQRNENEKYGRYRAFACETHRWQNGPNLSESPNTFIEANEKFTSKTIFKLKF
ncbi:aldose epimerase family protein [uncultured Draconibacterium sp.]|uniref:aldose epimerase family protein n=1 Tax=uncultured Draconibacterium sp. TaxID=1573823 RepID=UPI0025FC5A15|nr:aldose epimerase family protein [uncultured Draconibacterium sp.]